MTDCSAAFQLDGMVSLVTGTARCIDSEVAHSLARPVPACS